jgi:hypothetical protein
MADLGYDEDDDSRDRPQEVIDWLSDKSPDIWFDVSRHLTLDNAMPAFDWIAS